MPLPAGDAGVALVLAAVLFVALVAFLPTLVVAIRGVEIEHVLIFFLLNLLACPTIIGWFIVLGYAFKWPTRRDLSPASPPAQPTPRGAGPKSPRG